jgi:inosine-uridine nucleoside N-ribohydrolase
VKQEKTLNAFRVSLHNLTNKNDMKQTKWIFFIPLALGLLSQCHNNSATAAEPIAVIIDTDVGNDIDDVMALQMLFNYEKDGVISIEGITIGKSNPYVIEYIDGYCRFNNRGDIPLGYAYNGANPDDGKYLRPALDTVIDGSKILQPRRFFRDSLPEGYKLLRQVLAAQKDASVVFIAVGPETNLARLLDSPPDEYSDLDGVSLVRQKVKLLSVMGGGFDEGRDSPEWNILQDLPAAGKVFDKWPTEIVASGWETGNKLLFPHQSILNDFADACKHPLCVSYKLYEQMPYDRQTWDLTATLYAIEPDKNYFDLSPKGRITIDSIGKSVYVPDPEGRHRYLSIKQENIASTLRALVEQTTNKKTNNNH